MTAFHLTRARQDRLARWFPVVLLSALAALTYWLNIQVQVPTGPGDSSKRHDPDYFLDNFTGTRLGADGKPRQTLSAVHLEHFPDDNTTHLDRPNFTAMDPDKPPMRISALRGVIVAGGTDAFFYGSVRAERDAPADPAEGGPLTLTTEYLHIVPDKDWVETDRPVTITEPRAIIHGTGMQFNSKTRVVKLLSQVRGEFQPTKQ
jgi:lipopolysaccharide export system protein LptC